MSFLYEKIRPLFCVHGLDFKRLRLVMRAKKVFDTQG